MPSKYHAKRVKLDGYTFDSKVEARRYEQLKLLERAGEIRRLEIHPRYQVVPASMQGKAVYYVADFTYREIPENAETWAEEQGRWVVEDVKGFRTPLYRLKVRLFLDTRLGVDFREIDAKDV